MIFYSTSLVIIIPGFSCPLIPGISPVIVFSARHYLTRQSASANSDPGFPGNMFARNVIFDIPSVVEGSGLIKPGFPVLCSKYREFSAQNDIYPKSMN